MKPASWTSRGGRAAGSARAVLALSVLALLLGCTGLASAKKGPKPVISEFRATPASVVSGASTTLSASVTGARTCTLAASPAVKGLPVTFPCESGTVSEPVTMPENHTGKPVKYKLSLSAAGSGGAHKAKLDMEVGSPTASYVSAGGGESCAIMTSGSLECWGVDRYGELGTGAMGEQSDTPRNVSSITDPLQVSVGNLHACALLQGGHVDCWGDNEYGQLGDGTSKSRSTPTEVLGITEATQVAAGRLVTCALLADGHVMCWGDDDHGQLGDGEEGPGMTSDVPVEVVGITNAVKLATYAGAAPCALLSSGTAACWGEDQNGELGDGSTSAKGSDVPVEVLGLNGATSLSGGEDDRCATVSGGEAECWGEGSHVAEGAAPVPALEGATEITAQLEGTCARFAGGSVECLGTSTRKGPPDLKSLANVVQIAAGREHECALLEIGHILCWGQGGEGQLGDGKEKSSTSPQEVFGI